MLDEREEFECYTAAVEYTAAGKKDILWIRRINPDMLLSGEGFVRVLTIVARGYMWEKETPDIDRARRALCAWCSIPDVKETGPREDWENKTDHRELCGEFPELVDAEGNGWLIRHLHGICRFAETRPDVVPKSIQKKVPLLRERFPRFWRDKVIQYQVPIFSQKTKGAWLLRFDDVLGEALELGPLRGREIFFTAEQKAWIAAATPTGVDPTVLETLIAYYLMNRAGDSEWVVLPVTSFTAYFGNSSFDRKWLPALRESAIRQDETSYGISRFRIVPELLEAVDVIGEAKNN